MSLLLLITPPPPTPVAPVVTAPAPTSTAWFSRPSLAVDTTGWLSLGQILAEHGIDPRRMYEIADANGIIDLRRIPPWYRLTIP